MNVTFVLLLARENMNEVAADIGVAKFSYSSVQSTERYSFALE